MVGERALKQFKGYNSKKIWNPGIMPWGGRRWQKFTDFRWFDLPCPTKFTDNLQNIHQSKALIELSLKKISLSFSDHFAKSYKTPKGQNVQDPYREGWLPLGLIIKVLMRSQIAPTLFSYVGALSVLKFCWETLESGTLIWGWYGSKGRSRKIDFL